MFIYFSRDYTCAKLVKYLIYKSILRGYTYTVLFFSYVLGKLVL